MNSNHNRNTQSGSPFQQLDLNLLKIFEALYQERNMSRAAQRLHLTPSAVSHAIKRLRSQLADPLFSRQGNMMQPTALCESLAPALINNLDQLRQILQLSEQFSPQTAVNYFRLGIHEALENYCCRHWLQPLPNRHRAHPLPVTVWNARRWQDNWPVVP